MRLSDAMRLGATLKPQGLGGYLVNGRTCAWGAAFDAQGKLNDVLEIMQKAFLTSLDESYDDIERLVGWDLRDYFEGFCPVCKQNTSFIIAHLNDNHLWSREQIADWVEQTYEQVKSEEVAAEEVLA